MMTDAGIVPFTLLCNMLSGLFLHPQRFFYGANLFADGRVDG